MLQAQKQKKCPPGYRFDKKLQVCVPTGVSRYYPYLGGVRNNTNFTIGEGSIVGVDIENNPRPNPSGTNPDMGAYENSLGTPVLTPDVTLSGTVTSSEDGSFLGGVFIVVVEEDNLFTAQGYTDASGAYSFDVVSGMNYYVNIF